MIGISVYEIHFLELNCETLGNYYLHLHSYDDVHMLCTSSYARLYTNEGVAALTVSVLPYWPYVDHCSPLLQCYNPDILPGEKTVYHSFCKSQFL